MTASSIERLASVATRLDSPEEAEAIVVGSGFGGAVTACRLAQAGVGVLVIERGRRYEAGDFPTLPTDSALLPDLARWSWQQGQGLWDIVDLEETLSVQAAGYGGGSLTYASVHLRPPGSVFDERWPAWYRKGERLEEFYDLSSFMLDVAPIDAHETLAAALTKPEQMGRVACHVGRGDAFFHPPLAISFQDGPNVHGRQQSKCTGCGGCCTGCPHGAKNSLDFNYLAVAENRGARVVTLCEVVDIEQCDDGAWLLTCVDQLAARKTFFKTRNLFLCAGSIHSTRLLARARLGPGGRRAQSLAGIGYFPNADAFGMVYDTTHPQYPSFGPAITTSTVCWDPDDRDAFFLIQDGGYARELERLMGVPRGAAWLGRNRLTSSAPATVDGSRRSAPPSPIVAPDGLPLVSPVDDVLTAIASGAFAGVASEDMRRNWSALLGEIKGLLPLSAIVDRTIDLTVSDCMKRLRLTSLLERDWWIARFIARVIRACGRWLIRTVLGNTEIVADRAFRAMVAGANLGRADIARRVLGYGGERAEHRVMLLAMGRDDKPGELSYDRQRDRLIADLDLYHLIPRYTNEEQVMTEMARALGGELRTNPAWAFLGKPIAVHNQGGCPMSEEPKKGVTTPDGQVHGCDGLYILDGSIFCTSVGVNPSATIMAIAERNIVRFIRRYKENESWPDNDPSAGALEYRRHLDGAKTWAAAAQQKNWSLRPLSPPSVSSKRFDSKPLGLRFKEVMQGYYVPTAKIPERGDDDGYRRLEIKGRPTFSITLALDVSVKNLARLFEDCRHEMQLSGDVTMRLPGQAKPHTYAATGRLELFVEREKPYGIGADETERRQAQERLLGSRYTTIVRDPGRGQKREKREMTYVLAFKDCDEREWVLQGYKSIRDDPGPDAWRDTSSLFVSLHGPPPDEQRAAHGSPHKLVPRGAGAVHVDLDGFLHDQLPSLQVVPDGVDPAHTDGIEPARAMWARMKFAAFFFGTLQRIYLPELRPALAALFKGQPSNVQRGQPRSGSWERPSERAQRSAGCRP